MYTIINSFNVLDVIEMGSSSLIFWIIFWILFEIMWIRTTNQLFAIGLIWSLLITYCLLTLELDIIAVILLSSSVAAYLAIAISLLHIGQSETITNNNKLNNNYYIIGIIFIIYFSIIQSTITTDTLFVSLVGYVDSIQALNSRNFSTLLLLHEFFYSLFIVETWLLNLYITAGLVLVITLLFNNRKMGFAKVNKITTLRLKSPARLRRQSRRKDGSLLW